MENIGKKIQRLIDELDMTQTKFASDVGISQATLNHYINNRRKIPTEFIKELSDKYNIDIDYFFSNEVDISKFLTTNKTKKSDFSDIFLTLKSNYLLKKKLKIDTGTKKSMSYKYLLLTSKMDTFLSNYLSSNFEKKIIEEIPIIESNNNFSKVDAQPEKRVNVIEFFDLDGISVENRFLFIRNEEVVIIYDEKISSELYFSIAPNDIVLVDRKINLKNMVPSYYCVREKDKYAFYYFQKIENSNKVVKTPSVGYNINTEIIDINTINFVGKVFDLPFVTVNNQLHYYSISSAMLDSIEAIEKFPNAPLLNMYGTEELLKEIREEEEFEEILELVKTINVE